MPGLREQLCLKKTPHFTTLQKAWARLLIDEGDRKVKRLITHTLYAFHGAKPVPQKPRPAYVVGTAAADSTGFDASRASRYFVRRRRTKLLEIQDETLYRRCAELGDLRRPGSCDSHLILATYRGRSDPPIPATVLRRDGVWPVCFRGPAVDDRFVK